MKVKLFYIAVIILCFSAIITAQESVKFKQEFDTWKTSIIKEDPKSQNRLFFMIKAIRNNSKSATVEVGLFGVLQNYEITLTPLRYEKSVRGKLIKTKTFDEVKLSTQASNNEKYKNAKLHTPKIKLPANSEVNALSIELITQDGKNPRITVNLLQDCATYGSLLLR